MPSPEVMEFLTSGGFTAVAIFLIYWTLRTTGEREKSFRDRELQFIGCMNDYARQIESGAVQQERTANLLAQVGDKLTALDHKVEEQSKVVETVSHIVTTLAERQGRRGQ